jgi:serine/threonine protein kinase
MALETLTTLTFSVESDVWSYGVTLWEIFTLADIPFPSETWDKDFLMRLSSGMRMGRPKYCTLEM